MKHWPCIPWMQWRLSCRHMVTSPRQCQSFPVVMSPTRWSESNVGVIATRIAMVAAIVVMVMVHNDNTCSNEWNVSGSSYTSTTIFLWTSSVPTTCNRHTRLILNWYKILQVQQYITSNGYVTWARFYHDIVTMSSSTMDFHDCNDIVQAWHGGEVQTRKLCVSSAWPI